KRQDLIPDRVTLPEHEDDWAGADLQVVRDNQDGSYRVEIITDMQRYVSMVQKGLMNRDVIAELQKGNKDVGPEMLFHNKIACDMEGHFHGANGVLKLEPQRGVLEVPFPEEEVGTNGHHVNGILKSAP